jgi:hypothetical protein
VIVGSSRKVQVQFLDRLLCLLPVLFQLCRLITIFSLFHLVGEVLDRGPICSYESQAPHVKRQARVESFASHFLDELPKMGGKSVPMRNDLG